jgi:RHS repeat-associated protein
VRRSSYVRMVSDHLGTPRLVVNSSTGEVVQRIDFDEWGNVLGDTNPGFQPFGFAGGLWDRDLKLLKFGARDYDPEVSRWVRMEPLMKRSREAVRLAMRGQALNAYVYARNDPLHWKDSTGLEPETSHDPERECAKHIAEEEQKCNAQGGLPTVLSDSYGRPDIFVCVIPGQQSLDYQKHPTTQDQIEKARRETSDQQEAELKRALGEMNRENGIEEFPPSGQEDAPTSGE